MTNSEIAPIILDSDSPVLALVEASREAMGRRVEVRDAALRRALWLMEDFEITGILDRVELQACLREVKVALKS